MSAGVAARYHGGGAEAHAEAARRGRGAGARGVAGKKAEAEWAWKCVQRALLAGEKADDARALVAGTCRGRSVAEYVPAPAKAAATTLRDLADAQARALAAGATLYAPVPALDDWIVTTGFSYAESARAWLALPVAKRHGPAPRRARARRARPSAPVTATIGYHTTSGAPAPDHSTTGGTTMPTKPAAPKSSTAAKKPAAKKAGAPRPKGSTPKPATSTNVQTGKVTVLADAKAAKATPAPPAAPVERTEAREDELRLIVAKAGMSTTLADYAPEQLARVEELADGKRSGLAGDALKRYVLDGEGLREQIKNAPARRPATSAKPKAAKVGLSGLDACAYVLAESDAPMKIGAITGAVVERGLAPGLKGATPAATMSAAVTMAAKKGSRFVKTAPGTFDLLDRAGERERLGVKK